MASLCIESTGYLLRFCDNSKSPRIKKVRLNTHDESKAKSLKQLLEDRYSDGTFDPWVSTSFEVKVRMTQDGSCEYDTPVGILTERFVAERERYLTENTMRSYRLYTRHFTAFIGKSTLIGRVTKEDIENWLNMFNANKTSRKTILRHLSVFFNWVIEQELLMINPCKKVKLAKAPTKFAKNIAESDLEHLLKTIRDYIALSPSGHRSEWFPAIIEFAAFTGLRRGELLHLKWKSVDLDKMIVRVINDEEAGFTTKSGADRVVPLSSRPLAVLQSLLPTRDMSADGNDFVFKSGHGVNKGGRIHPDAFSVQFRKFAKMAGLPNATVHSLRHSCLSNLASRGVSIESLRMLAGHSSIQVTARYTHVNDSQFHEAITGAFDK